MDHAVDTVFQLHKGTVRSEVADLALDRGTDRVAGLDGAELQNAWIEESVRHHAEVFERSLTEPPVRPVRAESIVSAGIGQGVGNDEVVKTGFGQDVVE